MPRETGEASRGGDIGEEEKEPSRNRTVGLLDARSP
jgi:hypothetical protein